MQTARVLPDWLDGYIDYVRNTEPPVLYNKWVGVSLIAACLQRKCYIQLGHITLYPNMYIVLVGPSGCRKGTAMEPALSFLEELGIHLAAESTTREQLIRRIKSRPNSTPNPETGIPIIHCSITVFSKELSVFLGYNNLQLLSDLTDWYDCKDNWTYDTKTSGTDRIDGVWVNLLGATTPQLIASTLPRDAIGGGLTSRMIFVYEERKGKTIPPTALFHTKDIEELGEKLRQDLERVSMISGKFVLTTEASNEVVEWYLKQDKSPPFSDPNFEGYCSRRAVHALKLSMIMSASRSNDRTITLGDFERALSLLRDTERKMKYTFTGFGESQIASILSRVMAFVANKGKTSVAELLRFFKSDADYEIMLRVIVTLEHMKAIRKVVSGDGNVYIEYIDKED